MLIELILLLLHVQQNSKNGFRLDEVSRKCLSNLYLTFMRDNFVILKIPQLRPLLFGLKERDKISSNLQQMNNYLTTQGITPTNQHLSIIS
jgi:hypothetical protein